ncbi:MAG TPA: hypothetical protein VLA39_12650 [Marinobacterium sp.]|nr:hypothetical protein [Marinobacterium sp.]
MLRWVFLLALLANALLFFWYAQKYHFAQSVSQPDFKPSVLRLPSELRAGESLMPRPRECASFAPLSSEYEASRLVELLREQGFAADYTPMPPVEDGVRLEYPLPADAEARIAVLDDLARAGWVPESRDGALVLGSYADQQAAQTMLASLPQQVADKTRIKSVLRASGDFKVSTSYLVGYEITSEIKQLINDSWLGIKFEKNLCEGVASP